MSNMRRKGEEMQKLPLRFIIRIYRFTGDGPDGMAGVVETVGNGEDRRFSGIQELGKILADAGKRCKMRRK